MFPTESIFKTHRRSRVVEESDDLEHFEEESKTLTCRRTCERPELQERGCADQGIHEADWRFAVDVFPSERAIKLGNMSGQAVKETKQMRANPFNLYYLPPDEDSKDNDRKTARKATNEFKALWRGFVNDWRVLQEKYSELGALDGESEGAQVDWIKRHAVEVH